MEDPFAFNISGEEDSEILSKYAALVRPVKTFSKINIGRQTAMIHKPNNSLLSINIDPLPGKPGGGFLASMKAWEEKHSGYRYSMDYINRKTLFALSHQNKAAANKQLKKNTKTKQKDTIVENVDYLIEDYDNESTPKDDSIHCKSDMNGNISKRCNKSDEEMSSKSPVVGNITNEDSLKFKICANCKSTSKNLQLCSRCKNVAYCGRLCQKADWNAGHRGRCQPLDVIDEQNGAKHVVINSQPNFAPSQLQGQIISNLTSLVPKSILKQVTAAKNNDIINSSKLDNLNNEVESKLTTTALDVLNMVQTKRADDEQDNDSVDETAEDMVTDEQVQDSPVLPEKSFTDSDIENKSNATCLDKYQVKPCGVHLKNILVHRNTATAKEQIENVSDKEHVAENSNNIIDDELDDEPNGVSQSTNDDNMEGIFSEEESVVKDIMLSANDDLIKPEELQDYISSDSQLAFFSDEELGIVDEIPMCEQFAKKEDLLADMFSDDELIPSDCPQNLMDTPSDIFSDIN